VLARTGIDRPILLVWHDAKHHLVELRAFLAWPRWPSVAPPQPSKYSDAVSKKAIASSPNNERRWA